MRTWQITKKKGGVITTAYSREALDHAWERLDANASDVDIYVFDEGILRNVISTPEDAVTKTEQAREEGVLPDLTPDVLEEGPQGNGEAPLTAEDAVPAVTPTETVSTPHGVQDEVLGDEADEADAEENSSDDKE